MDGGKGMWRYLKREISKLGRELRVKIQGMIKTIVEVEKTIILKDDNGFYSSQIVNRGDIVHVKFVGMGAVINRPHYAIVWEVNPKADHIIVIPMTSKPSPKFDLGFIPGMSKPNNVVKLNQLQCVSRKSFEVVKRRGKKVILSPNQLQTVESMFRKLMLQESSLKQILFYDVGNLLPLQIPIDVLSILEHPGLYHLDSVNDGTSFLHFISSERSEYKKILMVPVSMKQKDRKDLLKNLVSTNEQTREAAERRMMGIFTVVTSAHSRAAAGTK